MKRKTLMMVVSAAVVALAAIGAWLMVHRAGNEVAARYVVLISIDTLRADHVGCYGYPRPITPNIDQLATEGVRFANVISPAPLTLPAHASMLTGTIPPVHGVHNRGFCVEVCL